MPESVPRLLVRRADLSAQYREIKPQIDAAISNLLERAELIGGPTLRRFETAFANRCDAPFAVGTSSGTAALMLALLQAGVRPGGEVLVPAFTFAATAAAVVHCGATPVFVDVLSDGFCMDPQSAARAATDKTQAVIPVHIFGRMASIQPLRELNVPIVEDAAQAFLATSDEGVAGSLGDYGCFSFHPSKNLGLAGDGGMIVTGSEEGAASIRRLGNHGRGANGHVVPGYAHRLDAIQAAVGLVKLDVIDAWTARRRRRAKFYCEALAGSGVTVPPHREGHVYHQFPILHPTPDALAAHLADAGIATGRFYHRPVYAEPAFEEFAPKSPCTVAESIASQVLCLPIHEQLSDADQELVVAAIREFSTRCQSVAVG